MTMSMQEFQAAIDAMVAASGVPEESCCSTCTLATCCHETVYAGKDEAQWMLDSLTAEQLEYVRDKTREWSVKAVGTGLLRESRPHVTKWLPHKIPCPFLKDKRCIAYERRPMSCRLWFARSNPENCDFPGREHQQLAHFPPKMGGPEMTWFDEQMKDGTVHMDHLGAVLSELLFGINLGTKDRVTSENLKDYFKGTSAETFTKW